MLLHKSIKSALTTFDLTAKAELGSLSNNDKQCIAEHTI